METQPEEDDGPKTLASIHSSNMGPMLGELRASVLITTYQAGRLVILGQNDEGTLNTHFCMFNRPMGLAVRGDRLAIGVETEIREFHDLPAVARKLPPVGTFESAYLPCQSHNTGDIQIHEMAWVSKPGSISELELLFVNTRFSCLCKREMPYSFVPVWRPNFVSAIAPEDRCHLNGLAIRDNMPRYVTALGESDTRFGWRDHKKDGGILIDIQSNEIMTRGLSMPHSPRWYAGKLWVLNSGCGGFGTIDPSSGKYEEVARLPGFTRGLDFAGPLAFIGLSQVRESATFSGIEIADRPIEERACGLWVVNIYTGQTVGYVKFNDALQEIFAVALVPRYRMDVIVDDPNILADSFVLPDQSLQEVASLFRENAPPI